MIALRPAQQEPIPETRARMGLMKISVLLSVFLLLLPAGKAAVRPSSRPAAVSRTEMADRVRAELLYSWHAYERYAWGHDELKPLSRTTRDWYGEPVYMPPVDSLDTLLLLGFKDEAEKARTLIVDKLPFDKDVPVKNFEV